jgi:hypothetical protein
MEDITIGLLIPTSGFHGIIVASQSFHRHTIGGLFIEVEKNVVKNYFDIQKIRVS